MPVCRINKEMDEIHDALRFIDATSFYHVLALSFLLSFLVHRVYLQYPIQRQKKIRMINTTIIGHRGSSAEGLPENSTAAFKEAIKAGVTTIEFDVWLTLDGMVVIHHDETLLRMSGGRSKKKIWECNYFDLPPLAPLDENQRHRCHQFPAEETSKIPLFDDIIALLVHSPQVSMIIEFKSDYRVEELMCKVNQILHTHKKEKDAFWFSLRHGITNKLRGYNPAIPTITPIITVFQTLFFFYIGLLPFVDLDDAVFGITLEEVCNSLFSSFMTFSYSLFRRQQVTLEKIRRESALQGFPDWCKVALSYIFAGKPPTMMLCPSLFAHLRKRGIAVWFLGVNEEEHLTLAIETGNNKIQDINVIIR